MTLEKLKQHSANDVSGTDWAAALAYVPARSQESYQILRDAMEEELYSVDIGTETLRKSLSVRELHEQEVKTSPLLFICLFYAWS